MLTPVLMIAEKFPPHATSGTARPFFFVRHLPDFGYRPIVLTSPLLRGDRSDPDPLRALPDDVEVVRAFRTVAAARSAFTTSSAAPPPRRTASRLATVRDTAAWLALWHLDWLPAAFVRGVTVARRRGVQLIWVTAPHTKNLVLGYALSRALNRPLVVDLRDPLTDGSLWQPISPLAEKIERGWARRVLGAASLIVFTSPLTQRETEARFPGVRGKCRTITNGYSAEEAAIEPLRGGFADKFLLRHTGALNHRRTPDVLLQALHLAIERQPALRSTLHLELVGHLGGTEARLVDSSVAPNVSARGHVSRAESLALMRGADVNVLLQTVTAGTDVIAGKVFDYLASEKPILAVVDPGGGDAWLLRQFEGATISPCADPQAVANAISALHARWMTGTLPAVKGNLAAYERRHLSQLLAEELDRIVRTRSAALNL
jgi:glycosyltransferase involved in cell wall biosynthesis